jgi:chromosomal replication initiator protein
VPENPAAPAPFFDVVVDISSVASMDRLVETMVTRSHSDLWEDVVEALRAKLGDSQFGRWIAPLKVLSDVGTEVRLGVSNRFVQVWIEERYLAMIEEALRARHGAEVRVRVEIDPALFQEGRQRTREEIGPLARRDAAEPAAAGGEDVHCQTLESFVVGESNKLAFNAAMKVLESPGAPYNPLFLHGPSGVGKTHLLRGLLRAFRSRRRPSRPGDGRGAYLRVACMTGEQFFQQFASSVQDGTVRRFRERQRSSDILIIDDVHMLVNKRKTQVEFLHTFTSLVDSGRQIILASDVPPKAMKEIDPALVGRFLSGLVAGMRKPDFDTRLGIARARARRLSSPIGDDVLQFLAQGVRSSAREIIGALLQLDMEAQLGGGKMTVDRARGVLARYLREQENRIDLARIHRVVAQHYRLDPELLTATARERRVSLARQVAMYLARRYTSKSLSEIGKYFGNRNYSTVRCAVMRIDALSRDEEGGLGHELNAIMESLEE